jgi:hypothetical protein
MATTTFTSPEISAGVQPKGLRVGLIASSVVYSFTAVSLTAGDVIQLVKVPQGATVVGMLLSATQSAGSITIGDGVDADRYHSGYAMSVSAGVSGMAGIYVPYTYSTDDTIDATISASVSMSLANGALNLTVLYAMDT